MSPVNNLQKPLLPSQPTQNQQTTNQTSNKQDAIVPEILPNDKGLPLNRNWLKVRRRKNITGETIARPESKTAAYDQFIFREHLGFQKKAQGSLGNTASAPSTVGSPAPNYSGISQKPQTGGNETSNVPGPPNIPQVEVKTPQVPEVKTPQVPEVKAPTSQGQQQTTGTQETNVQPTPTTNVNQQSSQPAGEQQSFLTSAFKGMHDVFRATSKGFTDFARGAGRLAESVYSAGYPVISFLDVLSRPRIEIHEIPDIPLLDEFIKDPTKSAEIQSIFKGVYSRLGTAPPIVSNTLNRMYELYQKQDQIRTPYEAERFRRQVSRMGAVLEGVSKWYRYGTELLAKHKDILEQETTTSIEDATSDEARKASIAAGIAAAQFLRAYDTYRRNNVDFPEEKQRARLMEAVRNAYYSYAGGSDPESIDRALDLAVKLVQAEFREQNKPQTNQAKQPQQPQQQKS